MRYIFMVLVCCFALPVMGQKEAQLPFNQKSYPQLFSNELLGMREKSGGLKHLLEQHHKEGAAVSKTEQSNMPIHRPELNSFMPVHPVDTTQTYFLQVYPVAKG